MLSVYRVRNLTGIPTANPQTQNYRAEVPLIYGVCWVLFPSLASELLASSGSRVRFPGGPSAFSIFFWFGSPAGACDCILTALFVLLLYMLPDEQSKATAQGAFLLRRESVPVWLRCMSACVLRVRSSSAAQRLTRHGLLTLKLHSLRCGWLAGGQRRITANAFTVEFSSLPAKLTAQELAAHMTKHVSHTLLPRSCPCVDLLSAVICCCPMCALSPAAHHHTVSLELRLLLA